MVLFQFLLHKILGLIQINLIFNSNNCILHAFETYHKLPHKNLQNKIIFLFFYAIKMSDFLEKFKGKTNLIGKDGVYGSLDKQCNPIPKKFLIKHLRNNTKPKDNITEKSVKSAILPFAHIPIKTDFSKNKVFVKPQNQLILRERKVHSFSSQRVKINGKKMEKLANHFIIKTENDIPNPKTHDFNKKNNGNQEIVKKLIPSSLRTTPIQRKKMINIKTEGNFESEKKTRPMEEIQEKEEFEENQRKHYDFLTIIEKMK